MIDFINRLGRKKDAVPILFLISVIVIAFGLPVLLGYSLLSQYVAPSIFPSGIYREAARAPSGPLTIDPAASTQMMPWNKLVGDSIKRWDIPLWNPYSLTGIPLLANIQSAVLFPIQIFQDLMPSYLWSLFYVLRFCVAGLFTFLFLRSIGLEGLPSLAGGILYTFSGAMILYFRLEPAFNSNIMLPVVLYFFERLYGEWDRKNLMFASLSFGFLLFSGQPEITTFNALFSVSYSIFRVWQKSAADIKWWKSLMPLVMYPLGILIAMPLLLPVFEYLSWMIDKQRNEFGKAYLNPVIMALQIAPYLLGDVHHYITQQAESLFPWVLIGGYIGIIGTYLSILAVLSKTKGQFNGVSNFMIISTLLILTKIYGLPHIQWIGELPVLRQFWFTRYSGAILTISAAILAAIGAQALKNSEDINTRKRAFLFTAALSLILLLPIIKLIGAPLNPDGKVYVFGSLIILFGLLTLIWLLIVRRETGQEIFVIILLLSAELLILTPSGLKQSKELLRIISIVLFSFLPFLVFKKRWYKFGILLFTAIGFMVVSQTGAMSRTAFKIGLPKTGDLFTEPPFITFLKERQSYNYGRTYSLDGFLNGNYSAAFGIYGINVCEALIPSNINEFAKKYLDPNVNPVYFDGASPFRSGGSARESISLYKKYYDFIGVRFFVANPDQKILDNGLIEIYKGDAGIWENPSAFPRTFAVPNVKIAGSTRESLNMLGSLDLKNYAVIASENNDMALEGENRKYAVEIKIEKMEADKILLSVEKAQKGLLVITDTYYPGWVAKVDGKIRPIYETNGAFRGIFLKEGDKEVILEYKPRSFLAGAIISITTIFCLAVPWQRLRHKSSRACQK